MTLAQKISDLRVIQGYTLEQLARETGSSKSCIWALEKGTGPRPSAAKVLAVAQAFNVTIDYLMDDNAHSLDDAENAAFFRTYRGLPENMRRKIRMIVNILQEKEPAP